MALVAIYGMEIAGRLFYFRVRAACLNVGVTESHMFQATYCYSGRTHIARLSKFSTEQVSLFIATQVGDFLIVPKNEEFRKKLMEKLKMTFTFGSEDQVSLLLGLEIKRNRRECTIEASCGAKYATC